MLQVAIDEVAVAARADQSGSAKADDLAERLARLWSMIAELDPALAARLRGYGPDAELWRRPGRDFRRVSGPGRTPLAGGSGLVSR